MAISNIINNSASTFSVGTNPAAVSSTVLMAVGASQNASSLLEISNGTNGTAALAGLFLQANTAGAAIEVAPAAHSNAAWQNKLVFETTAGCTGITLYNAQSGSNITFYTGAAVLAATISSSQVLTLVNALPVGSGGTGVASPTAHSLPVAEGSSAFTFVGPLTNGQLLIGSTGADPVAATLTAGTGMTISNTAGAITLNATGGGVTWTTVASSTQQAAVDNGYIINNGSLVTVTLPTTAAIGQSVSINGFSASGWSLAQNASQLVYLGSTVTTTGTGGSLASTNRYDTVTVRCIVANTTWQVDYSTGNLTVT